MTFFTPAQDFVERTLEALPTELARLRYLAGLRDGSRYSHWGLARVYGDDVAHRTIADAHQQVWLGLLRMPLEQLLQDLTRAAEVAELSPGAIVEELLQDPARLLPLEDGGGSPRHFDSIMTAISALLRARTRASQPAA